MLLVEIYQIYPIIHTILLDIVGIPMALAFPHYTYIYVSPVIIYILLCVYIYIPLHFYWKYRPTGWYTKWDVNHRLSLQLHTMFI